MKKYIFVCSLVFSPTVLMGMEKADAQVKQAQNLEDARFLEGAYWLLTVEDDVTPEEIQAFFKSDKECKLGSTIRVNGLSPVALLLKKANELRLEPQLLNNYLEHAVGLFGRMAAALGTSNFALDDDENRLLHLLAMYNFLELVPEVVSRQLQESEFKIDTAAKNEKGLTAFELALKQGPAAIIQALEGERSPLSDTAREAYISELVILINEHSHLKLNSLIIGLRSTELSLLKREIFRLLNKAISVWNFRAIEQLFHSYPNEATDVINLPRDDQSTLIHEVLRLPFTKDNFAKMKLSFFEFGFNSAEDKRHLARLISNRKNNIERFQRYVARLKKFIPQPEPSTSPTLPSRDVAQSVVELRVCVLELADKYEMPGQEVSASEIEYFSQCLGEFKKRDENAYKGLVCWLQEMARHDADQVQEDENAAVVEFIKFPDLQGWSAEDKKWFNSVKQGIEASSLHKNARMDLLVLAHIERQERLVFSEEKKRGWLKKVRFYQRIAKQKLIEFLVSRGASLEAIDGKRNTIFHLLVENWDSDLFGFICELSERKTALQEEDSLSATYRMTTGLASRIYWNWKDILAEWKRDGFISSGFILLKNTNGDTVGHIAIRNGDLGALKKIIDMLGEGNQLQWLIMCTNNKGNTLVHESAECGNSDMTEFLLKALNSAMAAKVVWQKNTAGFCPVHLAIKAHSLETVQLFESPFVERTGQGDSSLHLAAYVGDYRIVSHLVGVIKRDKRRAGKLPDYWKECVFNAKGQNPLHSALCPLSEDLSRKNLSRQDLSLCEDRYDVVITLLSENADHLFSGLVDEDDQQGSMPMRLILELEVPDKLKEKAKKTLVLMAEQTLYKWQFKEFFAKVEETISPKNKFDLYKEIAFNKPQSQPLGPINSWILW